MNVSIVIPVYNEEKNIEPLYSSLTKFLKNSHIIRNYEIIFTDDGSTDNTYNNLSLIKDNKVRILRHKIKKGQTKAIASGLKNSKFNIIVTMDGDLQNDPSDIEAMLKKLEKGCDWVCGWRCNRKDPLIRKISSKIANYIRRLVLKDSFHDSACGMHAFRKRCLEDLPLFKGAHRFFPVLIQKAVYKVVEQKIKHHPRKYGKPKYNIRNRIFKSLKDMIYVKRIIGKKQ